MQNYFSLIIKIIILLSIILISCNNDPIVPDSNQEIWPLQFGNEWVYDVIVPSWVTEDIKLEFFDTVTVTYKDKKYKVYKRDFYVIDGLHTEYQWLYWNGPEGIYFMGGVSPTDTFVVKELMYKYPATVGETWQCVGIAYSFDSLKFYIKDTLDYSLVKKDAPLETPAGKYNCYVYEFASHPAGDVMEKWIYNDYLSPGIGLVGNITIGDLAGDEKNRFLLKSYKLNN